VKVFWSEPSISDLKNIKDYIAKDSPYYATIFIEKIISAVEKLDAFPLVGRVVPECNDKCIREVIYQHYRIIYKINHKDIIVLTIVYGGRDLSGWAMN
jgi:addiction module RelE/StbE family toxin